MRRSCRPGRPLSGRPAERVAKEQDGALPGRQVLDGGEVGDLHRLPAHGYGVGLLPCGCRRLEQVIGIRLQPRDLFGRVHRDRKIGARRHDIRGQNTPTAAFQRVEAHVRGDPVQPRADRGPALERRPGLPCAQERLLEGVVGVINGAEHPVAVDVEPPPVLVDQASECRLVARADGSQNVWLRWLLGGRLHPQHVALSGAS